MTRQVSDILIYEGEQYPLLTTIHWPENDERVVKLTDEEYESLFDDPDIERKRKLKKVNDEIEDKLRVEPTYNLTRYDERRIDKYTYKSPVHITTLSTCLRKYIATWEIKEGMLYLSEIAGQYKLVNNEAIFFDWYMDTLELGIGEPMEPNFMQIRDIYYSEKHIEIKNGLVTNTKVIEHDMEDLLPYRSRIRLFPDIKLIDTFDKND